MKATRVCVAVSPNKDFLILWADGHIPVEWYLLTLPVEPGIYVWEEGGFRAPTKKEWKAIASGTNPLEVKRARIDLCKWFANWKIRV